MAVCNKDSWVPLRWGFFVKPLSELRLSSHTVYVTNANMAVTLAQFLWFLQNKREWIRRGQNHSKHGHVESCSYANTEFVASVRDLCSDVNSLTRSGVSSFYICICKVWYFSSCKLLLSWLEKWSQTGSKNNLTTVYIFSEIRAHGPVVQVRRSGTLCVVESSCWRRSIGSGFEDRWDHYLLQLCLTWARPWDRCDRLHRLFLDDNIINSSHSFYDLWL